MKICILIFMFLVNMSTLQAQLVKVNEPEFTKEQQWLFDKTSKQMAANGDNSSTKLFLDNYRKLLSSDVFCKTVSSQTKINLDGERLDEFNTFIEWDVMGETENARYVVERRYNNPYGDFDSIGVIESRAAASAIQSYRFPDKNDYPGTTWYRLRRINSRDNLEKLAKVDGYENQVKVFPNPALSSSDIRLELLRFKSTGNTFITIINSKGVVIYQREQMLLNDNKIYGLENLKLKKGAYHIKVSNQYNSGSTSFIVQ